MLVLQIGAVSFEFDRAFHPAISLLNRLASNRGRRVKPGGND
jgi:hypothetical protein